MELNRTIAPEIRKPEQIRFQVPKPKLLSNDIPVYLIREGAQDVFRMELVFQAGRRHDNRFIVSQAVPPLLKEGSRMLDAESMAKALDKYGLNVQASANPDVSSIRLHGMSKYIQQALPLISEMVRNPAFSKKEVANYLVQQEKKLEQKLDKNQFLSSRQLLKDLYGNNHPLGFHPEPGDYQKISVSDLKSFHKTHYHAGSCTIFLSGKPPEDVLDMLEDHLGINPFPKKTAPEDHVWQIDESSEKVVDIKRKDKVQTAISIGKRCIPRGHVEFPEFSIVNTILGGYFGSRLMKNIREEKGYTYGIYSAIASYRSASYFYIETECDKSYKDDVLKEISYEIDRLKNELVSDEELDMVRNYMTGKLLSQVDGPFNRSNLLKGLLLHDLDDNYLQRVLKTIANIGPERVREIANKYLDVDQMHQVTVG